jgi:hypothetical protein
MTRLYFNSKTEQDRLKKIEIWWLRRNGYLEGFKSGTVSWTWLNRTNSIVISVTTGKVFNYVRLQYNLIDSHGVRKEFDYKVELTTSHCNLGGYRYWFICPLIREGAGCGRRVGVLYQGGSYFGCRHCYDLTYTSRNRSRSYRFYPPRIALETFKKIEELEGGMKSAYYAGKLTKRKIKLNNLYKKANLITPLLKRKKEQ